MVMHDSPAGFGFAKDKREQPVRPVVFALQFPSAEDEGGIIGYHGDVDT